VAMKFAARRPAKFGCDAIICAGIYKQ